MGTITIELSEAEGNLSELIEKLGSDTEFVITRDGLPLARLVPVALKAVGTALLAARRESSASQPTSMRLSMISRTTCDRTDSTAAPLSLTFTRPAYVHI